MVRGIKKTVETQLKMTIESVKDDSGSMFAHIMTCFNDKLEDKLQAMQGDDGYVDTREHLKNLEQGKRDLERLLTGDLTDLVNEMNIRTGMGLS